MNNHDVPKVILLAEDDPDDAQQTKTALRGAGVLNPVVLVTDGDEAIAYLKGEGEFSDRQKFPFPGILLLDLKMPRVDGFRVLSWLNFQATCEKPLVIVLSGHIDVHYIQQAYDEFGAHSFLIKPLMVTDVQILARVQNRLWAMSPEFHEHSSKLYGWSNAPR
jgi:CheY-like chemotaxis protein